MSTKTTIKRIALVAVTALGFGMLSTVPSQAAISGYSLTVDANDSISTGESATAILTQSFYATANNDSVTVQAVVRSGASNAGGIRIAVTDSATSATTAAGDNYPLFASVNSAGAHTAYAAGSYLYDATGATSPDSVTVGSATGGR